MEPKKKSVRRKSARARSDSSNFEPSPKLTLSLPGKQGNSNGTRYELQRVKNPYVPGEREKMIARREALTLKAFRIAYENKHPRKAS